MLETASIISSEGNRETYSYFLPSGFISFTKLSIKSYRTLALSLAKLMASSIFSSGRIFASTSAAKSLLSSPTKETIISKSLFSSRSLSEGDNTISPSIIPTLNETAGP